MGKAMSSDPTAPPVHGEILNRVQRRRRWSHHREDPPRRGEPAARLVRVVRRPPLRPLAQPAVLVEAARAGGRHQPCTPTRRSSAPPRARVGAARARTSKRLLGRKTMEAEILKEALDLARNKKTDLAAQLLGGSTAVPR